MIFGHPWFGAKNASGGWTPVSWEGWLVTAICIAAIFGALIVYGRSAKAGFIIIAAIAALLACCYAIAALLACCYLTGARPG